MEEYSPKTRLYIHCVILAGLLTLVLAFVNWQCKSPAMFLVLLCTGTVISHWKVRVPGLNGTISVSCVLAFFASSELHFSEAVFVLSVASASQCLLFVKTRPRTIQILFNIASMALATTMTAGAYRFYLFQTWHLSNPIRLLIAACVFFVFNTFPVAVVISLTESRPFRQTWKECYFWSLPFYLAGSGIATFTSIACRQIGWQTCVVMAPAIWILYRSLNLYMGRAEEGRKHAEEISSLHLRTIEALALAIEAKDQTTANHLARVQLYAVEIGKDLGMTPQEIEALRAGALLHDIGKLAVPEHIISKPGKLTREEFEKMKIHPVVGAEILERVNFPYEVTPIVRAHHEKWNGEGYPDGLRGEAIPLGARILGAVDCLDALASDRQYRKALPLDAAMAIVAGESGKSFDPNVVAVLQRRYQELELLTHQLSADRLKGLSLDIKIERGNAPAAGFEQDSRQVGLDIRQVGLVKRHASFVTSIAAARREMQEVFRLTQELGSCLSIHDALALVAGRMKNLVPHDALAVYLVKGDVLKPEFVTGENFRFFSSLEIPVGMGLSGWVAENVKPILNGNPAVESGHLEQPCRFTTMGSAVSVPLVAGERLIGVMSLYQADKDAFSNDDLRVLSSVAPKIAQTVDFNVQFEQTAESAATDDVTGLPNLPSLFLHLDSEINRCTGAAIPLHIGVIDIDGFKQVNDHLGYPAGNDLLRKIGGVLRRTSRSGDFIARMGGVEFLIVMPGLDEAEACALLEECRCALINLGDKLAGDLHLSITFGIAACGPDGTDSGELISKADSNMYEVKRRRKLQRSRLPFIFKRSA
jgi:diguanylate cyclase (GGDEF)-like protein/putative nucleotidyltransferase with HDIG domain